MAQLVTMGAQMQCTSGTAPSVLVVAVPLVTGEAKPTANILDSIPISNIPPFGTCNVLTAAAAGTHGVGTPALNSTSKCVCSIGGSISILNPGTTKEMVA